MEIVNRPSGTSVNGRGADPQFPSLQNTEVALVRLWSDFLGLAASGGKGVGCCSEAPVTFAIQVMLFLD